MIRRTYWENLSPRERQEAVLGMIEKTVKAQDFAEMSFTVAECVFNIKSDKELMGFAMRVAKEHGWGYNVNFDFKLISFRKKSAKVGLGA